MAKRYFFPPVTHLPEKPLLTKPASILEVCECCRLIPKAGIPGLCLSFINGCHSLFPFQLPSLAHDIFFSDLFCHPFTSFVISKVPHLFLFDKRCIVLIQVLSFTSSNRGKHPPAILPSICSLCYLSYCSPGMLWKRPSMNSMLT